MEGKNFVSVYIIALPLRYEQAHPQCSVHSVCTRVHDKGGGISGVCMWSWVLPLA
jgi:hypothetical protein